MQIDDKAPSVPKDGWEGLKQNFVADLTAGFVVFLLALPLSLGIAKASEFPPVMGLVTAIIGGLLATFFTGSKLTIKGPAAGLIVIVAGAVTELGGGVEGWHLALGVMVVAGLLQVLFGVLKLGKFVDFFPLSAIHGMLAAIGLIIIAKQIPVLLNVDPALMAGKGPLALFAAIPEFFANLDPQVAIIGGVSLAIMLGWSLVKHPLLKQIPAPLLVLLFAIPAGMYLQLGTTAPAYTLVKVGVLTDQVGYNVDFSGVAKLGIFLKYVVMITLVGSLESLLTVKAVDLLDPYKRKSDPNKDMIAVGIANTLAAFVGGMPMISEVARSSANVKQGAKTRWSNFFHGAFLLLFAMLAYPLLEQIPNAALAAMLITVGINLAHPKEFIHTYKIGTEQLAIFITTIFFTLFEDLLIGIAAGMLLKMVIHLFRGASWRSLFKSDAEVIIEDDGIVRLRLGETALFTNYISLKKELMAIPPGRTVYIEIEETKIIDHSVMENLHHFEEDYHATGGTVHFVGLEALSPVSDHPLAARKRVGVTGRREPVGAVAAGVGTAAPFDEKHLLHQLKHYLPAQAALKDFVHHNSLHAFQEKEFFEGIFSAAKIFGIQVTFNIEEYRGLYRQGRIRPEMLDRIIVSHKGRENLILYRQKMLEEKYGSAYAPRIGRLRAQWKEQYKIDLDNLVQPLLFRIICSYLDQGIALWHFPFEDQGLLNAIRTLEQNSFSSFLKSKRVKTLLAKEDLQLSELLDIVVGDSRYYEQYLYDQQFGHKGWSGIINAIEDNPQTLLYSKSVSLQDFILLELLLEIDALDQNLGSRWQPLCAEPVVAAQDYFREVITGEAEEILQFWQEAFEWDYYDEVLSAVSQLAGTPAKVQPAKKSFQAMFCIDDREDSIRRHLETVDPRCETIGAPGFYGAAIYFQPYGGKFYEKNCPVAITPKHLIKEIEVSKGHSNVAFHNKDSHTFFRGFMYALSLGLITGFRMLGDLFRPKMRADIADAFSHMDTNGKLLIENTDPSHRENGLQIGYTIEEMADVVQGLLRGIGLTEDFTDVVYVIAHGSSSANNPHHGAHDCGACSGRPGAINARVFSFMANHSKVRLVLETRGIHIPDTTQFVGAMHDTASDEVGYYDTEILTPENAAQHQLFYTRMEEALDLNAQERARRFASIDINQDIKQIRKAIKKRSVSYFEPRPELGHGTNALCYVGSRDRMKGLFLDRRAFLQTYNYQTDPTGEVLLQVMNPLPAVCGGINLEYYFSRMDIEKMGAGTKLPHNVMGLIGVANSSDGDLRPGLPLQMIENHDPVRLLMMVEHRPEIVLKVIKSSSAIYDWFDKGWLHLVAISPDDGQLYHFNDGEFTLYKSLGTVKQASDIQQVMVKAKQMTTNHILDATKENIPVHIYPTQNK
ncbi:MAG: putative inorganic carbon transporter subunit DabA [Lewinella sp.]|uniref:putative inorganic carbon transporter subunit DabA n=1 Tax=Lewinella sp. TaxID=2004506 RepID=UPI003D6A2E46